MPWTRAAPCWCGRATRHQPRHPPAPGARATLLHAPHLAEKILTARSALEGERKQVTVLFADLKGSLELIADRDPEEARQILDPVLEHLMAAVAPLRGHGEPGHGGRHYGALWGACGS